MTTTDEINVLKINALPLLKVSDNISMENDQLITKKINLSMYFS